jgi:hypothetical protein
MRRARHVGRRLRIVLPAIGLMILVAVASSRAQQASSAAKDKQIPTSGKQLKPAGTPDKERRGPGALTVPRPGATDPGGVVENIHAIVSQTKAEMGGIPELAGKLQAKRILRVKSSLVPGGYLVVELEDENQRPVALFAMTPEGTPMVVEDRRMVQSPLSLPLTDAAGRVMSKRGRPPLATEYVYFHNSAEPGISYCHPLVAATTEKGVVYLNSQGEAFVESGAPLEQELGLTPHALNAAEAAVKKAGKRPLLRSVGRW